MARNRAKLARLLGAQIVGTVPDVGGGAFGMGRLARILHERLTQGKARDQGVGGHRQPRNDGANPR
jgi:hypothetical protein